MEEFYRIREDAEVETPPDGSVVIRQSRFRLRLDRLGVGRRALVLRLAEGWVGEVEVGRLVTGSEGEGKVLPAYALLRRLVRHGWLRRRLSDADRPIAEIRPRGLGAGDGRPGAARHRPAVGYRLSRFATLRAEAGALVSSSPLGDHGVACLDPRLAVALGRAAGDDGCDVAGLAADTGLDAAGAGRVLDELLAARVLVPPADRAAEGDDPPLVFWSPEDLALHDRSRPGRHAFPVGGTFPFRGRLAAPPVRHEFAGAPVITLPEPDLDAVAKTDDSLTDVVRARRSLRRHDDRHPITLAQLAEFLARVQRATDVADSGGLEVARRPYPGAGAVYELEVYALVSMCDGLDPGLYHYESHGHRLELVNGRPGADRLVSYARAASAMEGDPQIVLVVTARVQRLMWKYEGLGYAMILKNAGVLTGLMYLVATAMGLAPCALGAGDSAAFAALSGLDPLVEPAVADFLLGSRRPEDSVLGSRRPEDR
ncbi:SagB family peptide dehydrogenase [Actinoplanes sp. HUAS TT8]|uniref:SagB family peptide dehydrogenase n=1 Tax=Actinoplanes sp. HUAS TT8 TaxID=3447453 RepID=UPI003F51CC73